MGTLQSFTPLPQQTFRLLLYNPSQQLIEIIQSPQLKQQYRLEIYKIYEFPLKQLLQKKTNQCCKKLKILIEQQNLIHVLHFIPIFHHQILIVRKQQHQNIKEQNLRKKQQQLKDKVDKLQKSYNPFQVQSFKLCLSIAINQLKKFIKILEDKQTQLKSNIKVKQSDQNNQYCLAFFNKSISAIKATQQSQQITPNKILFESKNLKRRNINKKQIEHNGNIEQYSQEIRLKIPKLLFGHQRCHYNPVSLIVNHLPTKMVKKIINLMFFYETNFVKYPSLETFLATECNSKNIVCGPDELQQIVKNVQMEVYPFKYIINSDFYRYQKSEVRIRNSDDSVFLSPISNVSNKSDEDKIINFYCFCKVSFQKFFTKNQQKQIELLKDKSIEIKFFSNILELIKQLFKDQHKINQNQILHYLTLNKAHLDPNRKLKSQKNTVFCSLKQEGKDNIDSNDNRQNFSKTFQDYDNFLSVHKRFNKKQSLQLVPPTIKNLSKKNISFLSSNRLNPTPHSFKNTFSHIPKNDRILPPNIITVYFFIHQKQKDRYVIQSLSKKIGRQMKNIKVKKISHFEQLGEKMQHQYISAVVINDSPKILQQFFNAVEVYCVEDKVVVIKRSENDTEEILVKKITQVIEIGMLKLQKFVMFSHSYRKFIVIGSKFYLKHILSSYPYIGVKDFVDMNLFQEQRKIREIISRKNQYIISSFPICDECNQQYQGILKANIIYYNSQPENFLSEHLETMNDCLCRIKNNSKSHTLQFQSLTQILESHYYLSTSYPYANKKIWQTSINLQKLFSKIKQKKYLTNLLDKFEDQNQILFFCADSWVIQQITMTILKTFNSKFSKLFLCQWMKNKIIYECIQQVKKIVEFHVNSYITIYKGQISSKISRLIEESKQIFTKMIYCNQESKNIFEFSEMILNLMIENILFRKSINHAWKSFISLNNHQYPLDCCTVFFVIFLGFRKANFLKRNDSINDGIFNSFEQFGSQNFQSKDTFSLSIDNFKNISKQKDSKIQSKIISVQNEVKQNKFSTFFNNKADNKNEKRKFLETENKNNFDDSIIKQQKQKSYKSPIPKVYLKLSEFQKSQEQGSLHRFFVSKNKLYSYIYTTQFLVFQTIDVSEMDQTILTQTSNKNKKNQKDLQMTKNLPKSNYPPKLINYRQRRKDSPLDKFSGEQKEKHDKKKYKKGQIKKLNTQNESKLNLGPLISNLFFSHHNQKKMDEEQIEKQDFLLELKSCRNIQIIPSTEDCLIICIENMEFLNYSLFIPYYKGPSKERAKSKFIIPPFTKLQINSDYRQQNSLGDQMSSAITHQLKLSPDHQQRFLQKFLEKFLVEQSQYYQDLTQNEKIQVDHIFDPLSSNFRSQSFNKKTQDSIFFKSNNLQNTINRASCPKFSRRFDNGFSQTSLIDEKFKLPDQDKFFILMNQFKYFSAHNLLIQSLPQTNMTNAYHAILLTRKGLYQQALNTLKVSNPFRFSIQVYISELKKRLNQIFQNKRSQKDKKRVQKSQLQVMKWKLNYDFNAQKFYLKSKDDQDISFCYNDDSLDVVYKQVLTKLQNGTYKNIKNQKGQNQSSFNSHTFLSNIFHSKCTTRKQKKQSSIAINIETSQGSQNFIQPNQNMLIDSSQIATFQTKKLSINSKDVLTNQDLIQQSKAYEQSPKSNGRRGSMISLGTSEFKFGNFLNLNKQKPQSQFKKHNTRFSCDKATLKSKIFKGMQGYRIQERESSITSESQSQGQKHKFIRERNKKITSIKVKTRFKSNFFRENAQQLKKYVQVFKNQQNMSKKQIINSQKSFSESSQQSKRSNEYIIQDHQKRRQQEIVENQGLKLIQNIKQNVQSEQKKLLNEVKKVQIPRYLFKNFRSQVQLQQKVQTILVEKQAIIQGIEKGQCGQQNEQDIDREKIVDGQIKDGRQYLKVDGQIKDGEQYSQVEDINKRISFSQNVEINKMQLQVMGRIDVNEIEQRQMKKQSLSSQGKNESLSSQDKNQSLQSQSDNLEDSENYERMQHSDMFGDEDKSRRSFKVQTNSRVDKLKCKYTLQFSSQSQSEESLNLITQRSTISQQISQKNKQYLPNVHQLKLNTQQNTYHNKKSPYKISTDNLQSQSSSIQSHNQLQIYSSPTQIQHQISTNKHKQIHQKQQQIFQTKNQDQFKQNNKNHGKNVQFNSLKHNPLQSQKDKTLFNFKFKKKQLQQKHNKQKEQEKEIFQKATLFNSQNSQQKFNQFELQEKEIIKRKDKTKKKINNFTFMKPSQQNSDGSIAFDQNQPNIHLQHGQIQEFHTKLIKNSSIFINQKNNASFLASQLNLNRKKSIKKDTRNIEFSDSDLQGQQRQKVDQLFKKNQHQYKIYPQQLILPKKDNILQTQEIIDKNIITDKGIESEHKLDFVSLKKLRLNCDIRRKR